MAKSGSFTGSSSGSSPYLRMDWDVSEVRKESNSTRVRVRLYLVAPSRVNFSSPKTGDVDGNSFTYSGGMSGTGTKLIRTQYLWINHNSAGVGSRSVTSRFHIKISYSGWLETLSVTGTIKPDDIPTFSELESASVSGTMSDGGTATLNVNIDKKLSSYWLVVAIWDGADWVADWGYTSGNPSSLHMNSTIVGRILDKMPTQTTKDFTVKVNTYTGNRGTLLGSSSINIPFTVSTSEKPNHSDQLTYFVGDGWDNENGIGLTGMSRVYASFFSDATRGTFTAGASISVEGGGEGGGVSYTSDILTKAGGNIKITFKSTDGRGRSTTSYAYISVYEYSAPIITSFTAERLSSNQSTIVLYRSGRWNNLGGRNNLRIKIERRVMGNISWSNVENILGGMTNSSFSSSKDDTYMSSTSAYEYRLTITDDVGNSAVRIRNVSTAKVLLNLNKDIGVGIGKMHQRGVLDVDGEVWLNGTIRGNPKYYDKIDANSGIEVNSHIVPKLSGYEDIGSSSKQFRDMYARELYLRGNLVVESGSNNNGNWVKLYDGTMIAWYGSLTKDHKINTAWGSVYYGPTESWTYPIKFSSSPRVFAEYNKFQGDAWVIPGGGNKTATNSGGYYLLRPTSASVQGNIDYLAIGRWY